VPDFPLRNTGWLAAATLARIVGSSCPVHVVTLPDDLAVDGAIASVPSLHGMLRLLRIDDRSPLPGAVADGARTVKSARYHQV